MEINNLEHDQLIKFDGVKSLTINASPHERLLLDGLVEKGLLEYRGLRGHSNRLYVLTADGERYLRRWKRESAPGYPFMQMELAPAQVKLIVRYAAAAALTELVSNEAVFEASFTRWSNTNVDAIRAGFMELIAQLEADPFIQEETDRD